MARFSALRASWNWKSYLAKAVATEADSTFYRQSCRSLGLRVLDTMMKKSLCWQQQIHHMLLIRLFGERIYIPPQLGSYPRQKGVVVYSGYRLTDSCHRWNLSSQV